MKKLSKDEMKKVMGGTEDPIDDTPIDDGSSCETSADCKKFGSNCVCLTRIHRCGCVS